MTKKKKIKNKKVIAKISDDGKQKRLTVPKQKETENWGQDDLIKLEKLE